MKKHLFILASLVLSIPVIAQEAVKLNQVGYFPHQQKIAIVENATSQTFQVTDSKTKKVVLKGKLGVAKTLEWGGKKCSAADFSAIVKAGSYTLKSGKAPAVQFVVKDDALAELAKGAMKAFYFQRMSMPIEEKYAGRYARPSAHPDNKVMVHSSAASAGRPTGTIIESAGGWYDAGDYNKYIVNSAFTIALINDAILMNPDFILGMNLNIPESGNNTPDVIDELCYNLKWMLTMQDPEDGGVYHKLTTASFEDFIAPTDCKKQRYVVQKSVTAAYDFAAVMAQSSRILAKYQGDYPGLSVRMIMAARRAYDWAKAHPETLYDQDKMNKSHEPQVSTGTYGDNDAKDESFWAATEMYLATGDAKYKKDADAVKYDKFTNPTWGMVASLAHYSMAISCQCECAKPVILAEADHILADAEGSCYNSPFGNKANNFHWGCLAESCANPAITLLLAYKLTGNEAYLVGAQQNMDYILGRNSQGYCYVTGFGKKSPMHPHHRLSQSDNIEDPVPGLLVGGPNKDKQDGMFVKYSSEYPNESYEDNYGSYASNEIAINWNASLVALVALLESYSK